MIAALGDGSLRRWDFSTGKERPIAQPKLEKFPPWTGGGRDGVNRAVFSRWPIGRLDRRGWVQVVDLASGDRRFKAAAERAICTFAPDGGAWRSSETPAQEDPGGPLARLHDPHEHDRLARQPDGSRAPRDRDPRIPRAVAGVFPGRAGHRRRHPVDRPGAGDHPHLPAARQAEIQTIESPCPWIEALRFTPDGKQIVAGLQDTSIVIWDVRPTD